MTKAVWRARIRRIALAASLGISTFSLAPAVLAQADPLAQARQQLEARQPAAAFELLSPLEPQRAGDPAFDYLLGIAALDAGHPTRAIFALERVLAVQPGNNLARAEIARAYLAAGETDTARGELVAARRGPMPADAAAAIDRVLSELSKTGSAAGAGPVSGYLELGAGWDSNINSATSTSQFALPGFGGLLFTLAPGSRKQDSAFATAGGGVGLRQPLSGGTSFVGSFSGKATHNASTDDFDPFQLDASAGLAHTDGADTLTGALQLGRTWIEGNGFRNAAGLSGQWQRNLSASLQLAGFAQWARLTYPGQGLRDADRYVAGAGFARALEGGDRLVYGSAYLVRETPTHGGVAHLGHEGVGARLGGEWQRGPLTWWAQAQAESRRYGGTEPFFGEKRTDDQLDVALGVHWRPVRAWRITPQFTHTRNHSSIVIFSYDRTVLQLMARREF